MAHFTTSADSPRPPEAVFDLLADMRNAASWDPGVAEARLAVRAPDGPGEIGLGTEFDVVVLVGRRRQTLRYRVAEYHRPSVVVLDAESGLIHSADRITVEALPAGGSRATYAAELQPKGLLVLASPLVGRTFAQIGRRAAEGLTRVLAT